MNAKLRLFESIFFEYSRVHNISGVKTRAGFADIVQDCAYPLEFLGDFATCLDLGSGAGFPGLVLACLKEATVFYLVEPNSKKAAFLNYAAARLELKNVRVVPHRIQEMQRTGVDLVCSKAFGGIDEILALAKPFFKAGTKILLYKGANTASGAREFAGASVIRHGHSSYVLIDAKAYCD
ncbi:MAG: 16S rRNA (guanine(527)-N(7))-methyltransferase RsmG [Helicobacteraceae bacterium]